MKTGLRVEDLSLSLGGFELRAHFSIQPDERVALIGRSGGGKTTLLRWIAGLCTAQSGRVFLNELELTTLSPQKRNLGFVFQEQALFPALSVRENIAFGLRVRKIDRTSVNRRVHEALTRVGLQPLADASISNLSGGERQRVALLRAWIWHPDALLLDEPFSALDEAMRQHIKEDLLALNGISKVPLLFVTHDRADIEGWATGCIELREEDNGRKRYFVR